MMDFREYEGSLEEIDLPVILCSLFEGRKTGNLILWRDDQVKSVYLDHGEISFASSNRTEDRLVQVLYRNGLLSREHVNRTVRKIRATGKRQGTVLIEEGLLTPAALTNALTLQVKEIFYSLLLWEGGRFEFHPGHKPRQSVSLSIDTERLVREMIERMRYG